MLITIDSLSRLTAELRAVGAGLIKPFSSRQRKSTLIRDHIVSPMSQGKTDFVVFPRQRLAHMLILRRRRNILKKTSFILFLFREIQAELHLCPPFLCSEKAPMYKIMSDRLLSPFFHVNIGTGEIRILLRNI